MRPSNAALLAVMWVAPLAAGLRTDIEYARPGGEPLRLDACTPDGPGPFPAAILVHGGGFVRGDKQTYVKPLFEPLTRAGYAWFSIDYRLAPQHRFPAPTDDVAAALAWVKAHAPEFHVDPRRIALIGESAGAHLVSYVGLRGAGVAAVVSFYGPNDLVARVHDAGSVSEGLQAFLGTADIDSPVIRRASPIESVHPGLPPFLLIHGTADPTVPHSQSVRFRDRILQAGGRCELFDVQGGGHGMAGWENVPAMQSYKTKLIGWLDVVLK